MKFDANYSPNNSPDDRNNESDNRGTPQGNFNMMGGGSFFRRWGPILLVVLLFALPWILPVFGAAGGGNQIAYSKFEQQLLAGNVDKVVIQGEHVQGTFKNPSNAYPNSKNKNPPRAFETYLPSAASAQLMSDLNSSNVTIYTKPKSNGGFLSVLLNFLPFIIMIWIFYALYRRMRQRGQNMFNVGKSQAKRIKSKSVDTHFDDIAGIDSAKNELEEIVQFLKKPDTFRRMGAKTPKGVLLIGPPGTGKTLLARAVAGEAKVPFFSMAGSDFMEMFVGVGASRVRNLFKTAKKESPSIIFIDEIDSIGRSRGAGVGGGHDEREQTLNQMLSEMDGFEPNESVIVMAATNRPDILDPALMRPGRFDRRVETSLPTMKDRHEILRIHARNKPFAPEVDLERVARNTPGFSGADLANLLNESALIAGKQGEPRIDRTDIERASDKIMLGLERTNLALTDDEKRVLAYHEGGHAVVATLLPSTDPVNKVTIIPRGRSMGVTKQMPERDKYLYEKQYLVNRLAVMMGGRASEQLKTGTITSGAENDLKQAQQMARKMVLDWGMSDAFENVAMGDNHQAVFLGQELGQRRNYSDETATLVDNEIKKILDDAYRKAFETLKEDEAGLDRVANALLDQEEITGEKVKELVMGEV